MKGKQFEKDIADNLLSMGLDTEIIGESSSSTDITTIIKGKKIFIEVKMKNAQLGSPRFKFIDDRWSSKSENLSGISKFLSEDLNTSPDAGSFLSDLRRFLGKEKIKIISTTDKKCKEDDEIVTRQQMIDFLETRENKYIIKNHNDDITKIVKEHYMTGKTERTDYIQIGDSFYKFSHNDPLGLSDVPEFFALGTSGVRVMVRSKRYEIVSEVKSKIITESCYSIKPKTKKENPFR